MVVAVKMAAMAEDVVALLVVVGLVAAVEVTLVDELEEVMTGQIILLVLM
jgi:hypothetical protein